MYATLTYWLKEIECISKAIAEFSSSDLDDQFLRGATCSLKQLKWKAELSLHKATVDYDGLIEIPTAVTKKYNLLTSDSIAVSDGYDSSSCESESDYDDSD